MEDHQKLVKTLKMLLTLANGLKHSVTGLSNHYEISQRTVHRYISSFREVGFAVEQKDGFYWINKVETPFKELHDLLFFTEEEALIIKRAIHQIEETNVLKKNLVEKLYSLYNYGKVSETIVRREYSETVHRLATAIAEKKQVLLRAYHSAHGNIIRDRLVEPFDFTSGYISVCAFDPESRTTKQFKTARIQSVTVTGKPFLFENEHKKQDMDVFRISTSEKIPVKLRLSLRAYSLLIEEYPMAEDFLMTENDNFWIFDGWVCSFDGIGRFAMGLCEDVEILAPQGLRDHIKQKACNLLK
jgi:predicted DNA-binding transcriptional regulator YafY